MKTYYIYNLENDDLSSIKEILENQLEMMNQKIYELQKSAGCIKSALADVSDGKWHKDFLDNNGAGFTFEDAEYVACELRASTIAYVKWAEVVEMEV